MPLSRSRVTLVRTATDPVAQCRTVELATPSAMQTSGYLIKGAPDVWECVGGLAPGDCLRGPFLPDIRYKGPPKGSVGNAEELTPGTGLCDGTIVTPITLVAASNNPAAIAACVGLGLSGGVKALINQGYPAPPETWKCL